MFKGSIIIILLLMGGVSAFNVLETGTCIKNWGYVGGIRPNLNFSLSSLVSDNMTNIQIFRTQCADGDDCNCDFINPYTPCGDWSTPIKNTDYYLNSSTYLIHESGASGSFSHRNYIIIDDKWSETYSSGVPAGIPNIKRTWNDTLLGPYQYNITFKNEEESLMYTIQSHNNSYLDIICTNGGDILQLNDTMVNLTFYTKEQPILSMKSDSGGQIRELTMDVNTTEINFYMVDGVNDKYTFTLVDYTSQCGSSLMTVETSINNTVLSEVNSRVFDSNNEITTSLRNNTPYRISVECSSSTYDFGFMNFDPSDTSKKIEITEISLGGKIDYFHDDLTTAWMQDIGLDLMGFIYNKTGNVSYINFSVSMMNMTPYYHMYSTTVSNSPTGVLSYTIPDNTEHYYMWVNITNNAGDEPIILHTTTYLVNATEPVIDLNVPVTGLFGVSYNSMYKHFATIIIGGGLMAFTFIDAGLGAILIVGLGVFFTRIGWYDKIPWEIWTALFIIAVMYKMTEKRYIE